MDRRNQLSNVAFGGAWSEQLADREDLQAAIRVLHSAVERAQDENLLLCEDVGRALDRACRDHPKGLLLRQAWCRGAVLVNAGARSSELSRISGLLEQGQLMRFK